VDDTESLGALDERARPRVEGARRRLLSIVDAARPGDDVAFFAAASPQSPAGSRSGDRVRLRRWAEQLRATSLPAPIAPSVDGAGRFLGRTPLETRELYVLSDFQRTSWNAEARGALLKAASLKGVRVYLLPLVQGRVANHGFEDLDPELRPGPNGRGLELRARLANHADAPSERLAVRVRHGDALVGGGDVSLRPDEVRWASMPIEWPGEASRGPAKPGDSPVASRLPDPESLVIAEADRDALAADDSWYAVLGPPRRLRVLRVVESRGGSPPPRFAALALDPEGSGARGIAVEDAPPSALLSLGSGRCDVVLLEDIAALSGDSESRLRAFLRAGGGLVVALGPHADPAYYSQRLFPGLIDLSVEGVERAPEGGAFEIRARAPGHPILEGLPVGVGATLGQARLTAVMRGRVTSPRAIVVAGTPGGLPLVVAAPRVAVFLGSFADDAGDLPYSGAFVPLVRGLVDFAARAAPADEAARPTVGARPSARLEAASAGALSVRGPAGYRSQASVEAEGTGFRAVADEPASAPGFYAFEAGERLVATVAVNVDPIESDLTPLAVDSLRAPARSSIAVLASPAALTVHLNETRRGRELWIQFLFAAALALGAELAWSSARVLKP
jgi:hypothetical protein